MQTRQLTIQDCGCISIPEDLSQQLGMIPGSTLQLDINNEQRSITLTATATATNTQPMQRTACPIA